MSLGQLQYKDYIIRQLHAKHKGKDINIGHDLAPCLITERNRLAKIANELRKEPTKYHTRLRNTPFKGWLETRIDSNKDWKPWNDEKKGKD